MKILLIVPNLEYGGTARQVTLLASGLPADGFAPHVCVLGTAGPWADELRDAGVGVTVLGNRHLLDPRTPRGLRRMLRSERPDLVHAWEFPAVRLAALLAPGRVVASLPEALTHPALFWPDAWVLARCARVAVPGPADALSCQVYGVPAERVAEIPPGVRLGGAAGVARKALGLPGTARLLLGVGPLERRKGFRDAVWAFNILQGLYDELHLVLLGTGPELSRLRAFARDVRAADRVHFPGPVADVAGWLADAEVVWVPDRAGESRNVVLEAQAAGRPTVASARPELAAVVSDGWTGLLVPTGDRSGLARQTRRLLDDTGLRRRLGEAGRRAAENYAADDMVGRYADLYRSVLSTKDEVLSTP